MRLFNTYLHVDSGSQGTEEEPAKSTGLCPAPKPMGHAAKHRDVGQPRDHWWVTLRASTAVTPHGARASALGSCGGGDMRQRQDRAALLCNTQCDWQIVPLEVPVWLEGMLEEMGEEQSSS